MSSGYSTTEYFLFLYLTLRSLLFIKSYVSSARHVSYMMTPQTNFKSYNILTGT